MLPLKARPHVVALSVGSSVWPAQQNMLRNLWAIPNVSQQ